MDGWIIISRAVTEHWIWNRPDYGYRWVDLILQVNFAQTKTVVDSQVVTCERGELITTCERLSRRWRTSRSTVQRFLKLLEKEQMICLVRAPRMTRITICNYDKYQSLLARGGTKAKQRRDEGVMYSLPSYAEVKMMSALSSDEEEMNADVQRAEVEAHLKEGNEGKERNKRKEGGDAESDTTSDEFARFYLGAFNSLMEGKRIKPISSIRGARAKRLLALEQSHGREMIMEVFRKAAVSNFLNGGGNSDWTASFDWLIDEDHFSKVLEGNFDEAFTSKKGSPESQQERDRKAAEERERQREEQKRKWEEEDRQRNSPENIAYLYKRFGGEELRQRAINAGLNVEELDREREVQSKKKR